MNLLDLLLLSGIVLIMGGFLLFFTALLRQNRGEHKFEGGGVLIIGPIPIVFGTSQKVSAILIILAIILTLIVLSTFILTSMR